MDAAVQCLHDGLAGKHGGFNMVITRDIISKLRAKGSQDKVLGIELGSGQSSVDFPGESRLARSGPG
jgi:hypothetical protein